MRKCPVPALTLEDIATLRLALASAWLYGTISRGRAAEVCHAMGWNFQTVENLKFLEERNKAANHVEYDGA